MKKILLLVAFAAASLVGCNVNDTTRTVFKYDQYAYVVKFGADQKPAGLLAIEVTYNDVNGVQKTEKVSKTWSYVVPAKKGFKMEMSVKLVLADGQTRPTSGNEVHISITTGISGVKGGQPDGGYYESEMFFLHNTFPSAYRGINILLDEPAKIFSHEIQPMLEPGMGE